MNSSAQRVVDVVAQSLGGMKAQRAEASAILAESPAGETVDMQRTKSKGHDDGLEDQNNGVDLVGIGGRMEDRDVMVGGGEETAVQARTEVVRWLVVEEEAVDETWSSEYVDQPFPGSRCHLPLAAPMLNIARTSGRESRRLGGDSRDKAAQQWRRLMIFRTAIAHRRRRKRWR